VSQVESEIPATSGFGWPLAIAVAHFIGQQFNRLSRQIDRASSRQPEMIPSLESAEPAHKTYLAQLDRASHSRRGDCVWRLSDAGAFPHLAVATAQIALVAGATFYES
jgi:hypothetical protein